MDIGRGIGAESGRKRVQRERSDKQESWRSVEIVEKVKICLIQATV